MRRHHYGIGDAVEVKVGPKWQAAVVVAEDQGRYTVQEEKIHVRDAASTLSVVCGGSRDAKVLAALPFFTEPQGLTFEGLTAYLTAVFKALHAAKPSTRGQASALDVATATARRAFVENNTPFNGFLDVGTFRAWYTEDESLGKRVFGSMDIEDAFELLAEYADPVTATVSRQNFARALGASLEATRSLFDAFDTDGNGAIDLAELAAGVSVWCRGSRHTKIRAAFLLFDRDGDGFISLPELVRYFTSVFRVALASNPDLRNAASGATPEALGDATAKQVLGNADKDHDGVLSFDEFAAWYAAEEQKQRPTKEKKNGQRRRSKGDFGSGERLVSALVSEEAALAELSAALRGRDPVTVFRAFIAKADPGTKRLSREGFYDALGTLYKQGDLRAIAARAFDLFDTDHDGAVDPKELAAGFAALCGGSRDAKVRFCFALFDADDDGYLDEDELQACLSSVFKVAKPNAQKDLAKATAASIIAAADTDNDGRVSYDEFDKWLSTARSPEAAAVTATAALSESLDHAFRRENTDDEGHQREEEKPAGGPRHQEERRDGFEEEASSGLFVAASELYRARHLLGLGAFNVDDVVDIIFDARDQDGIDAVTMAKVARRFGRLGGAENPKEAAQLIARILDALDFGHRGVVDPADLAAGFVVLAPSSVDDKTRAAFALYGDEGALSKAGLEAFLLAVYSFLYAASPGLHAVMDVNASPSALAATTATRCFTDLNLDPATPSLTPHDFSAFVAAGLPR